MKKEMKNVLPVLFGLVLIVSCLIPAGTVKAGGAALVPYSKNVTVAKYENSAGYTNVYLALLDKVAGSYEKVTTKSSNPKVVKIDNKNDTAFEVRKTGKSKLTFTVNKANGKTKRYTMNVTVVKYKNPVKSLKVGSVNVAKKYQKAPFANCKIKAKTVRISVKPASGWTVKSIQYGRYDGGEYKFRNIKNNTKVTLGEWAGFSINMYNKKTKRTEALDLSIN